MCLGISISVFLLVVLAGYFTLVKANSLEGSLKLIGKILGWVVIISAFFGIICSLKSMHSCGKNKMMSNMKYNQNRDCFQHGCSEKDMKCPGPSKDSASSVEQK